MEPVVSEIKEIIQTCYSCPTQWEGTLIDDRAIFIRYRGNVLEVSLSGINGTIGEAIDRGTVLEIETEPDDGRAISLEKVKKLSGLTGPKKG